MSRYTVLFAFALLLTACAGPTEPEASRLQPPEPEPAALLLRAEHPYMSDDGLYVRSRTFVYRLGLDGTVTTLPFDPAPRSPVRPDATGHAILYSKETTDPIERELRVYDSRDGSDELLLTGRPFAYGWDGETALALTGDADGYSIPPHWPSGSNRPILNPVLWRGEASSITTLPVGESRNLTYDLDFIGGDQDAWYFATTAGDLVSLGRSGGAPSVVATWGVFQFEISRRDPSETATHARVAIGNGLDADAFARDGVPMLVWLTDGPSVSHQVELRRASDWHLLRVLTLPADPRGNLVVSPDATLLATTLLETAEGPPLIMEVDESGTASTIATGTGPPDSMQALAYVGSSNDLVYSSLVSGGAEYYLWERATGHSRLLARLTPAQLLGTEDVKGYPVTPGSIIGIEYIR